MYQRQIAKGELSSAVTDTASVGTGGGGGGGGGGASSSSGGGSSDTAPHDASASTGPKLDVRHFKADELRDLFSLRAAPVSGCDTYDRLAGRWAPYLGPEALQDAALRASILESTAEAKAKAPKAKGIQAIVSFVHYQSQGNQSDQAGDDDTLMTLDGDGGDDGDGDDDEALIDLSGGVGGIGSEYQDAEESESEFDLCNHSTSTSTNLSPRVRGGRGGRGGRARKASGKVDIAALDADSEFDSEGESEGDSDGEGDGDGEGVSDGDDDFVPSSKRQASGGVGSVPGSNSFEASTVKVNGASVKVKQKGASNSKQKPSSSRRRQIADSSDEEEDEGDEEGEEDDEEETAGLMDLSAEESDGGEDWGGNSDSD